ncbi:MAG: hypothetical protein K2R98_05850 [Gemmataceae bacterium]|nr:hypothetical protein [Gemmataceae bacterium]
MKSATLLLALAAATMACAADDEALQAKYKTILAEARKQRDADLEKEQAALAKAKKNLATARANKAQAAEIKKLQDRVDELNQSVKELENTKVVLPKVQVSKLTEGKIAVIVGATDKPWTPEVNRIVDENNAVVKWGDKFYWVETPTKDMMEGKKLELVNLYELSGTKTYKTTLGGTNTVPFLKRFVLP